MSSQIIERFYTAFQNGDAEAMNACYHKDVVFNDPAFRNLDYDQACAMWKMLIERSKGNLEIEFHSVISDEKLGQCTWEARYPFSVTSRQVHNIIHATMEFKDDLIIRHTDQFDLWRWSSMALGTPGKLLGWTPYMKGRIRKMASQSLSDYMKKASS